MSTTGSSSSRKKLPPRKRRSNPYYVDAAIPRSSKTCRQRKARLKNRASNMVYSGGLRFIWPRTLSFRQRWTSSTRMTPTLPAHSISLPGGVPQPKMKPVIRRIMMKVNKSFMGGQEIYNTEDEALAAIQAYRTLQGLWTAKKATLNRMVQYCTTEPVLLRPYNAALGLCSGAERRSREKTSSLSFNRATDALRQPVCI